MQGRCNREKPPCKYFHPPQHLKDQLLINGRNHLALKNALMQQMGMAPNGQPIITSQLQPMVSLRAFQLKPVSLPSQLHLFYLQQNNFRPTCKNVYLCIHDFNYIDDRKYFLLAGNLYQSSANCSICTRGDKSQGCHLLLNTALNSCKVHRTSWKFCETD